MVCEGTWRFWGCARWPVDDGVVEDTTDKIRRDGWCGSGSAGLSTSQHGACARLRLAQQKEENSRRIRSRAAVEVT